MKKYILSIDQGTTSTRAILFNHSGELINIASREVNCLFPSPGWVEVDALSIWVSVIDVINEVMVKENITWDDIDSIGLTNQRETTVIWDKESGMPIYKAIVWQSRQSTSIVNRYLKNKEYIHQKTGLLINPYFSMSKIKFILENVPNGYQLASEGKLLCGTIDSWLLYKMSKGRIHATDVSNASRTMLFNIHTLSWDEDLLKLFEIPSNILPQVYPSSYDYGPASFFNDKVHIHAVAGDQQAALFGQTCFSLGEVKNTYGTGCFMLMNTGSTPTISKKGLLTTVAWQIKDEVTYALEGSVFIGGALVQWLRDEMKLIETSADSETKALNCESSNGIYIVPAFTGLGTPYWDNETKGTIFGLTRGSSREEFVRASLEAIAYQCKDVFEVMQHETRLKIKSLKVDGGATENNYLMQFQSDIISVTINLPKCLQTTALGAFYLAGLSSGYFSSLEEIKAIHCYQKTFKPSFSKNKIKQLYKGWKLAIKAARVFKL